MTGSGHKAWKRLRCAALLILSLVAVTASAQMYPPDRLERCAEYRQALASLQAQRANGGRLDTSMARAELDRMRAHYARLQKIEALQATGTLLGGYDLADREIQVEERAIVASAGKYAVQCGAPSATNFAADCIARFAQMIDRSATAVPDPQAVERAIADYQYSINAMKCGELEAASQASASVQAQAAAPGCHGFTGKWKTGYGPMWLVQNGSSITGFYDWVGSNGPRHDTLSGTVNGNVAEGTYSQPGYPNPEYQSGRFRFELSGNSFSGQGWSKSGGNSLGWDGTCDSH